MPFPKVEKIDSLIADKYSVSLMSDSKWDKLIEGVTNIFEQGVHVNYKLIHSIEVFSTILTSADLKPFFIEPILYKEVEWLEFPAIYEDFISTDNLKAGRKKYLQCIDNIEATIESVGQFDLERTEHSIKMFAYK
ncbi:DUF6678 family protein [Neptuniibacter sp. PT34_22]|uniref:DUF6678 family protein n=1 Tax=Neptuniibacter sp. PT34_22 TaxID=3398205 RepID=UPI0039F5BDB0